MVKPTTIAELAIGAVLLVLVPLLFIVAARASKSVVKLPDLARTNGWSYARLDRNQLREGPPFWAGSGGDCVDVVTGTSGGHVFSAFTYEVNVGQRPTVNGVVVLAMPSFLPVLEVRPQTEPGRVAPGLVSQHRRVELESEAFNRTYQVHADDAGFASAVMTPRLMEALLAGPVFSWRIGGRDLLSWSDSQLTSVLLTTRLAQLTRIYDAIPSMVWNSYGSAVTQGTIPGYSAAPVDAVAAPPTGVPAGWYPDPADGGRARFWDGSGWTTQVSARPQSV